MKRVISVFICIAVLFSFTTVAFSANKCNCDVNPVVFVHGFGSYPLYLDADSENPIQVFPPDAQSIIKSVPSIIGVVNNLAVTKNYKKCANQIVDVFYKLMGQLACDENGNSVYNVSIENRPLPTEDHHTGTDYCFHTQDEDFNEKDQYSFYYDFRLDTIHNAEYLNDYIKYIKELTGHDKVNIVCHSQGNTVVAAYLSKYENKDVAKVVFCSPAYQGLSLIGNILGGNVNVRDKSDALELYLKGVLGYSPAAQLGGAIISILNDYGVLPAITDRLQDLLDAEFTRVYDEALLDVIGTWPGIWAFCPDEYYEDAKAYSFKDSDKYAGLIEKIDNYHYNVQNKLTDIIDKCSAQGMQFTITAGYGISTIPVVPEKENQTDLLIDTKYMSIGATCADAGEVFADDYKQIKYRNGVNYVSPDMLVDASTCAYPDRTFFFRGQLHDQFDTGYTKFITDALLSDTQPTVTSMAKYGYSQFMYNDEDGNLINVTEPVPAESRSNMRIIVDSIGELIKSSFVK